jgi:hypothetical protein
VIREFLNLFHPSPRSRTTDINGINHESVAMISIEIADCCLDFIIKANEFIVSKGIRKINTLKVNKDIGL